MPQLDLVKTFQFEAAHRTPYSDDPTRLHGHSYTLDLIIQGPLDDQLGWVMDYADISNAFAPIYDALDHHTLNDLTDLENTTISAVQQWILNQTRALIPQLNAVHLRISGDCSFDPQVIRENAEAHLPDRIAFGFEAAHALPQLPPDHKCHAMHGHSFRVEVAAENLDTLSENLDDLYRQLDHQCLNKIPGLENPTSEVLSIWIWNTLTQTRDDLHAVLVAETCTARCIYYGR